MPCFRIMFYGEGEVRRACCRAQLTDWLVVVGVEASSFAWGESWVFDPDFEAPVHAYGCYEVGVDGWREPMDLFYISYFSVGQWMR